MLVWFHLKLLLINCEHNKNLEVCVDSQVKITDETTFDFYTFFCCTFTGFFWSNLWNFYERTLCLNSPFSPLNTSLLLNSHKLCPRFCRRRTRIRSEAARRWSPSRAAAAGLRLPLRTQTDPASPEPGSEHSGSASRTRTRTRTRPTAGSGIRDSSFSPAVISSEENRGAGESSGWGKHEKPTGRRAAAEWRRRRRRGWMDGATRSDPERGGGVRSMSSQ